MSTKIEWTNETWNPVTGCDRCSPGCDHCYALTLSRRLKLMGQAKYQTDGDPTTSGPGFGLALHPAELTRPYRWKQPRKVFVNSMSDLFHPEVPVEFIRDVFTVITENPAHEFQVLTKRSPRLALVADNLVWPGNLWMGVSVENATYRYRIDHLREVPAAVRFVSAEPLLGDLGEVDLTGIDWVIAGGESGPRYRPVDPDWVRSLRDRCTDCGVPFFFKQWGGPTPKSRGRELDGCTWDQFPVTC